jgi:NAD(P)-dependent dehydrogenase (short-subunit alcohol dehydrogenase family)
MALTDQVQIQTGFGDKPTGAQVLAEIDLAGKTAIVTGGYSGIGLETVRALAAKGVKVIVPVRSPEKAAQALAEVPGDVTTLPMDLADLASVRAAADSLRADLTSLDLLINNAGIMACPEARVGQGWESQFGINHMGHFALSTALMPLLQSTEGARLVALSSTAHKISDIRWDDIQYQSAPYEKWQAYGQAKTANALFANAMSRRLKPSGGHAFSVHPGGIFTPLQRHLPEEEMVMLGWKNADGTPTALALQGFKSPEQGCATTLWAATAIQLDGMAGVYCEDCDIAVPTDPSSPMAGYYGVDAHACNEEAAERLWQVSDTLLSAA